MTVSGHSMKQDLIENIKINDHLNDLITVWGSFLEKHNWQDLIQGLKPIDCGCGLVYEMPNYLNRPNEDLAIADMRHLQYSEPHYHPVNNLEFYFVLQGAGLVVVGNEQYHVKVGDVVIIPPLKGHYVIPDNQLVIAVVNTPPFLLENYIPLKATNLAVEFDYERFKQYDSTR